MNILKYKRIMVVGNNGSGKSYLSKALAAVTGLPLIHLDVRFWRPGWQETPQPEWIDKQREIIAADEWIIDGNHSGSGMEMRFAAAELVIFLDLNRLICLYGVLTRHGRKRSDLPEYLQERWNIDFIEFCKGLWRYREKRRHKVIALHEQYPDKPLLIIRSRKEMNCLITKWKALPSSGCMTGDGSC